MTYTHSIPVSGDTLGSTRDRIRGNFEQIAIVEAVNHVAFNDVGEGKHKYLQMPEVAVSGAGVPVTLANEAGFYSKNGTNPIEPNLWFRGQTNGYEYQLTHADQTNIASFANKAGVNDSGWTFLPGGLLLQYGLRTVAAKGTATTITFPKQFATVTGPFSITIGNVTGEGDSPGENNQYVKDGSVNNINFQIVNSSSSAARKVYWMAIGL